MNATEQTERTFPLYDWGNYENLTRPTVLDTTLRDGVQSLLGRYPSLDEKLGLMDLLIELGIEAFDIGFPVSSPKHKRQATRLAEHAAAKKPGIRLACLSRSKIEDVQAVVDVSQAAGVAVEAVIFVASSPARLLVEQWNVGELMKWSTKAIEFAVKEGIEVNFACEDATRSEPETLRALYKPALEHGATRFTLADTVGVCNVVSTTRIVRYFHENIIQGHPMGLDWHGHDDRGLAVANALAAVAAGATCVHTTVFGMGERCGNIAMEPLLANLHYLCGEHYKLDVLPRLTEYASTIFGETVTPRHSVVGRNAYTTAAGIHAASILKAAQLGRPDLSANVYAGFDPRLLGRKTEVQVGPLSGSANVKWKASQLGLTFSEDLAAQVLDVARKTDRILGDDEIRKIADSLTST